MSAGASNKVICPSARYFGSHRQFYVGQVLDLLEDANALAARQEVIYL
jgi:hypothetical protein